MTWEWQANNSAKGSYNMILGRGILTALLLNLKDSKHVIEAGDIPLKLSTAPMT